MTLHLHTVENARPSRLIGWTEKIPREVTGLNGSIFVHLYVDPATGEIEEIQVHEKGKDQSTLDTILAAVSETLTALVHKARGAK